MMEIMLLPNETSLNKNGYSIEEEEEFYDLQLQDVIDNPRWYLDNVETLTSYFVSWKEYGYKLKSPTLPRRCNPL